MSETGRKLDDNWTSQRKHGAKRPWTAAGLGASEIRTISRSCVLLVWRLDKMLARAAR